MSSKVYKAFDSKTKNFVAIKQLNPQLINDEVGVERFKREMQLAKMIQDPRIIKIYDFKNSKNGPCLVMEYLDGHDLSDYIKLNSPIGLEKVLTIFKDILEGLQSCHNRNIIHRDLKPQNIFILSDGSVKIIDLGISKMAGLSDLTQTGTSIGSPEYMAPELFAINTFDSRTDLYALGIILFEMLTGHLPYQGDTLAILFKQHLNDQVPDLKKIRKELPDWIIQIVNKLLEKNTFKRYQNIKEVLYDINHKKVMVSNSSVTQYRFCFECSGETIDELQICLSCGFGTDLDNKIEGNYSLWFSRNGNLKKFSQFINDKFSFDEEHKGSIFRNFKGF